jgi:hypothetical protein
MDLRLDKRDAQLPEALDAVASGNYTSIRAVAADFGVPRSTLQDQLHHPTTPSLGTEHLQRLSFREERWLAQWILEEGYRGYPPSHSRTREIATRILRSRGDSTVLGKR